MQPVMSAAYKKINKLKINKCQEVVICTKKMHMLFYEISEHNLLHLNTIIFQPAAYALGTR